VNSGEDAPFTISGLLQFNGRPVCSMALLGMLVSFDTGIGQAPDFLATDS
jgi:hypothetical protein